MKKCISVILAFFVLSGFAQSAPDNKNITPYWQLVTNRYAVINKGLYPLLFDYDYDFGAPKPSELGTYGQREGQVLRIASCNDRFHLTFSKSGICTQ